MKDTVFISVCITAYKRVSFLKRWPDSIRIQRHRPLEVVITDDFPNKEVSDLRLSQPLSANIRYLGEDRVTRQVFRNPELEIPENLYFLKKIGVLSPN